ncbi:MAG: tRNA threonylcarbamoyladenosine dehydratase [Rubrivivax sp.]|nr:tRNA threonylcarbamoyladenosine dehydratase [Rubrivivax sp.]
MENIVSVESPPTAQASPGLVDDMAADLERRFGGLRRLYGEAGYARLRAARIAVVGVGGVGSWAAEALARSGVAELVLVDLDHVAESNINRQVQALTPTLGQAKVQALAARIALIHPGCRVHGVEEFATADNWPALLPVPVDAVIDACDQVRAKETLARWAMAAALPAVCVGAAGGKRHAQRVEVADLAEVTHDPLLATLRQRLRKAGALPAAAAPRRGIEGMRARATHGRTLRCVFSREPVTAPAAQEEADACAVVDGNLNCHGYGSSVMVTATFGMVAAGEVVAQLLAAPGAGPGAGLHST